MGKLYRWTIWGLELSEPVHLTEMNKQRERLRDLVRYVLSRCPNLQELYIGYAGLDDA